MVVVAKHSEDVDGIWKRMIKLNLGAGRKRITMLKTWLVITKSRMI